MDQKKAETLARLIFQTAPPFRRNYIKPQQKMPPLLPKVPHHHLFCLIILKQSERESMSSLAEKLGVSNQQLTRIVSELVENGYAERSADETNPRVVCISATEKGKKLLELFFRSACRHIQTHFSSLSDEEVDSFIYHLSEIVKLFDKLER